MLFVEEISIVTKIPGTTRDVMRKQVIIEGVSFNFSDTAGIRQTSNEIEIEGIHRAIHEIKIADHLLWLVDCQSETPYLEDLNNLIADVNSPNLKNHDNPQ